MEGRLLRARSLSTLATRGRASSVDPLAGMARAKDDEFRKAMLDKVTRVKRSLSVRPDAEEVVRTIRQRHISASESRAPSAATAAAVFLPIRTENSSGLVLASGGGVEYWPTTVTDPGRLAVRYGSVQPETTRRRFEIDALTLPPAISSSRRRVLDEADDATCRGNRISNLLGKLKVVDGHNRYEQDDVGHSESRASDRLEVDTFAAALGTLSLPTPVGLSLAEVRRRAVDREYAGPDDFVSRLIHANGDLKRIEELASKTFNWNNRSNQRNNEIFAAAETAKITTRSDVNNGEQATSVTHPEVRITEVVPSAAQPSKEKITFYGDRSVGIRRIESAAEQAIRWAQERRLAVESELNFERHRERYGIHNMPTTFSVLGLVDHRPSSSSSRRYDSNEIENAASYHVSRAASRGPDRGSSVQPADRDFDILIRTKSGNARSEPSLDYGSNLEYKVPPRRYETPRSLLPGRYDPVPAKQHSGISEARRKIRDVLIKSKGDPHYFDRRKRQQDDDEDY